MKGQQYARNLQTVAGQLARYDSEFQTIELDLEEAKGQWLSVDLEEDLTEEELEKRIQEAVDEQYNRPEYNNYHKFYRHRGYSKAKPGKDDEEIDTSEPLMREVADDSIFRKDEIEREEKETYEANCQWIRQVLGRKTKWADAFIKVRLDGMSVNDYAASIGVKDVSIVSKWLARATKKLREN